MERLEILFDMFDNILDTRKKRHTVGGLLMSVSLFFGGLAITVITINKEEDDDDGYE